MVKRALELGAHNLQPEALFKRIEIAVAMKKRVSCFQTEGCNQTINRLTHRETTLAQPAIIFCGSHCEIGSASLEDLKILKSAAHIRKRSVTPNTL